MTLYTRRQIVVLLILLAIAGLGLAIGHWRRARPDVSRLSRTARSNTGADVESGGSALGRRNVIGADVRAGASTLASRQGAIGVAASSKRSRPACPSDTIDLNRATTDELTRLPGVGPALARRIVDVRDAEGPFTQVDDLGRVRGLSVRKVEKLRALVTIAK